MNIWLDRYSVQMPMLWGILMLTSCPFLKILRTRLLQEIWDTHLFDSGLVLVLT